MLKELPCGVLQVVLRFWNLIEAHHTLFRDYESPIQLQASSKHACIERKYSRVYEV